MSTLIKKITLLGTILILGCSNKSLSSQPTPTPAASPTSVIVLADISDEPTKKITKFQPIANYIAERLAENGAGIGEVRIAPDMETMAKWLASGEVDLYFDSPYPAMIVSDQSGAIPILRRWKDGVESYNSVIFALTERGFQSLDDLNGQIIAFEQEFSTSGYLLPLTYLIEQGYRPVEKATFTAAVSPDEMGYTFSKEDENTIQWVLSGRVAAAAVSFQDFQEIPEDIRAQLTILARTESLPRQLVMIAPDLAAAQDTIKTILMDMDETEEGRSILAQFEQTAQFDEFPEGAEAALAGMRKLYQVVENH